MSHVATEVVRYKDVEGRGRTWSGDGDIFFDYNILIKIVTIYFLVNKMAYPPPQYIHCWKAMDPFRLSVCPVTNVTSLL